MVRMSGRSYNTTFRNGLNLILVGLAIIVVSVLFMEDIFRVFPAVIPTVFSLMLYFIGSIMTGFGVMSAIVGLVKKSAGETDKTILPQIILLALLIAILVAVAFVRRDGVPPAPTPSGPIVI